MLLRKASCLLAGVYILLPAIASAQTVGIVSPSAPNPSKVLTQTFSDLPAPSKARQRDILKNITDGFQEFALEMFVQLSNVATVARKDVVLSPFAIWSLLLPLSEGADGNTLKEMRTTMRLPHDQKLIRDAYRVIKGYLNFDMPTLQVGSMQTLFTDINQPINREFEKTLEQVYGAAYIPLSFENPVAAADLINQEVRKATKNLITHSILPQELQNANLLLMSSLFFKGQWKSPFNVSMTHDEPFYDENDNQIGSVQMMMQIGNFNFTAMNSLEGHVLELPYGNENRLSMLIILPKKGVPLNKVAHNLQQVGLMPIIEKLSADSVGFEDEDVEVYLPKFQTTSHFAMNVLLDGMGIRDLFDNVRADLSKIASNLYVSNIMHSTKIIVDEEGTVAASVSASVLSNKATPPKFYLNRPFMYLIVEKTTNALLFCGHIMNPNSK